MAAGCETGIVDTLEAIKAGRLDEALAAAKEAVRRAPTEGRQRSVLFQIYCFQGNWEGAQAQLALVGDFDVEASLWVGVCEKLLTCEAERHAVFAGKKPPTLFGQPPEWVAGMVEAFRLGNEKQWPAAAASQAAALEAAPAIAASVNGHHVEWIADGDSRFGPLLEAYIDGRYYWIPFEHIRKFSLRPRTHLMDALWAPADFEWLNEGQTAGYIPVRYPGSEKSADPQIVLGRATQWEEKADNFYLGLGHRIFATDSAEYSLAEVKSVQFSQPAPTPGSPAADASPVTVADS